MHLSEQLYLGEKARKHRFSVLQALRAGKFRPDIYVITPPESRGQVLTVYPAPMLISPWLKGRDLLVLGIAEGREEAYEVVRQMVDDAYRETGGFAPAQWKE